MSVSSVRFHASQLQPKGLPVPAESTLDVSKLYPCLEVMEDVLRDLLRTRPSPYKTGLRRCVSFLAEDLEIKAEESETDLDDTLVVLRHLGVKHSPVLDNLGEVCFYEFYVKTDVAGKLKAPLDLSVLSALH